MAGDSKQRSISGLCEYVSGYFGREMSDDVKQKLYIVLHKFNRFTQKNFIAKKVKFNLELLLESASEDVIVGAWEMKPIEMEVDDDTPQAHAVERTVKEAQTQTRSARS